MNAPQRSDVLARILAVKDEEVAAARARVPLEAIRREAEAAAGAAAPRACRC
jgi:hypothetical protein